MKLYDLTIGLSCNNNCRLSWKCSHTSTPLCPNGSFKSKPIIFQDFFSTFQLSRHNQSFFWVEKTALFVKIWGIDFHKSEKAPGGLD